MDSGGSGERDRGGKVEENEDGSKERSEFWK